MDSFRILHISDLHFGLPPRNCGFPDILHSAGYKSASRHPLSPSSYDPDLAEALARFVHRSGRRLDAIIVSGDLATNGTVVDLSLARDFILNPAIRNLWWNKSGAPSINQWDLPILVIPGNHDRFDGQFYNPGGTLFDRAFGTKWRAGNAAQILRVFKGISGEHLAFLGADFCLRSKKDGTGIWGYLGQGKVYQNACNALVDATDDVRNRFGDIGVVWVVHFPPEFQNIKASLALIDDNLLANAAAKSQVPVILCGHTHEPRKYPLAGGCLVYCAGTATQYYAPKQNILHVLEFEVAGANVKCLPHQNLHWDQRRQSFS